MVINNGIIIEFGISVIASNTQTFIVLPTTYNYRNYKVLLSIADTGLYSFKISVGVTDLHGFTAVTNYTQNVGIHYLTIG